MIAIDLSKQQALDADCKAVQWINFTANLDSASNTRIYFILEGAKETVLDFWQETVNFLKNAIKWFNFYLHKTTQ